MEVSRKREREHEDPISELTSASPVKIIEGVVLELSPMKKGRTGSSFFDGTISDGVASMRFVGFDSKVRRRLVEHEGKDTAVTLTNCEVKQGRRDGDGLEVCIRNSSEISVSETKFDVKKEMEKKNAVTSIKEAEDMAQYQRVTVEGKVVQLNKAEEVSGGKKKQDMVVADSSGSIRVTIWEEMIGKVKKERSYRFSKMMVRAFKGKKFLSTSKTGSEVEEIDDIGEVEVDDEQEVEGEEREKNGPGGQIKGVKIVGVERFFQYNGCFKCSGRVEEDKDDADFGECAKCKMYQCLEGCKHNISVQLTLKSEDGSIVTLRAFDKVLCDITKTTDSKDVNMKVLLKAEVFNIRHFNGIIQSINRSTTS